MLVKLSTDKTVSEATTVLHSAVQAEQFGARQVHSLKDIMANNGVEFVRVCQNFQGDQPQKMKQVLGQNMGGSTEWSSSWLL